MIDTFRKIADEVQAQTTLDIELCRLYTRDSFRDVRDRFNWSWRLKRHMLSIPAAYSTGTATFTEGSDVVEFVGATLTSAMIGRQIRPSTSYPPHDIVDVTSSTTCRIFPQWGSATLAASAYTIIKAYVIPPSDCFSILSAVNLAQSCRLNLNVEQSLLDFYDPRRSSSGTPLLLSPLDYTLVWSGNINTLVQVAGAGSRPLVHGSYTGTADALYTIEITATGAVDVATFRWRKDEGSWTAATCSSAGNELSQGVGVTWPTGSTFTDDNIFVVPVKAASNPSYPRYEIYPHCTTATTIPLHYISTYGDIDEPTVALPRFISGHLVKEGALARAARTPGDEQKPVPYAQKARAENHEDRFEIMLADAMRQDEEVFARSVMNDVHLPLAGLPWSAHLGGSLRPDYDPLWMYDLA